MPTLLPNMLDDLEHGVDYLLDDCLPQFRESTADKIARELDGIGGTTTLDLVRATQHFARHGDNGAAVREAFSRFAVDNGPAIGYANGVQQQASALAQRGAVARARVNEMRQDQQIAWLARALEHLRPRARNVDHAFTRLTDKIENDPAFAGDECPEDMPRGRVQLCKLINRVPNLDDLLAKK